jgi:hypothetical protein
MQVQKRAKEPEKLRSANTSALVLFYVLIKSGRLESQLQVLPQYHTAVTSLWVYFNKEDETVEKKKYILPWQVFVLQTVNLSST